MYLILLRELASLVFTTHLEMINAEFTEEEFVDSFDMLLEHLEVSVERLFRGSIVWIFPVLVVIVTQLTEVFQQRVETLLNKVILETDAVATLDLVRVVGHLGV